MGTNEKGTRMERRDVLRVGALAVGAALLPRAAGGASPTAALAPGDDYQATIGRAAEELRPRFESGELHGFRDYDDDRQDPEWCEQHGVPHNPDLRDSLFALEDAVAEKVLGFVPESHGDWEEKPARRAAWVLMHSPSTPHAFGGADTLIGMAMDAMARDVLRIARQRRWYVATSDECPSNDDLGLEGLETKEAPPPPSRRPVPEPDSRGAAERIARRLDHDTGQLWAAIESTRKAQAGVDYALASVASVGSANVVARAAHELHMASGRLYEAAAHVAEDTVASAS